MSFKLLDDDNIASFPDIWRQTRTNDEGKMEIHFEKNYVSNFLFHELYFCLRENSILFARKICLCEERKLIKDEVK